VKLLLQNGANVNLMMADRQTALMAVLAGRAPEPQALEIIAVLHEAGADLNVIALINHREESRGGTALHYAVRKRYKEAIKKLAEYGIDMNARDQDGLTALDYTQSRGFMAFMAVQTPLYNEEAALLRKLGATEVFKGKIEWPVLGPPQGIDVDIWPIGEPVVHDPVYTHAPTSNCEPVLATALSGRRPRLPPYAFGARLCLRRTADLFTNYSHCS